MAEAEDRELASMDQAWSHDHWFQMGRVYGVKPGDTGARKPGHYCWGSSGRPLPSLCPGLLSTYPCSCLLFSPLGFALPRLWGLSVALLQPLGEAQAQRPQHSRPVTTCRHFSIILSILPFLPSILGPGTGALKDHHPRHSR